MQNIPINENIKGHFHCLSLLFFLLVYHLQMCFFNICAESACGLWNLEVFPAGCFCSIVSNKIPSAFYWLFIIRLVFRQRMSYNPLGLCAQYALTNPLSWAFFGKSSLFLKRKKHANPLVQCISFLWDWCYQIAHECRAIVSVCWHSRASRTSLIIEFSCSVVWSHSRLNCCSDNCEPSVLYNWCLVIELWGNYGEFPECRAVSVC